METNYIADTFSINPFEAYRNAFGYVALPFPLEASVKGILGENAKERLSKLGTALFKRDKNGQEAFCPVTIIHKGREFNLPYSTIAISMKKRIEETTLLARAGSVKELIAKEDYQFTIRGVMLSDADLPEDEITDLSDLYNIDEPVALKNPFSDIFIPGDSKVVVRDIDLPDMKGLGGAQAYTIKVSSDAILELEMR